MAHPAVESITLAPGYACSRLLRGGWQLAGGHGAVDRARAVADMAAFLDAGVTTFDCADIYTGVEEMIGAFRAELVRARGAEALSRLKVHTKFVPDWDELGRLTRPKVEAIIDRSLARLQAERLDLVQFHWWNYAVPGLEDAAGMLVDLQKAGKIDRLGATNFDAPQTRRLIAAGLAPISMQVQYSLIDRRPETALVPLCAETGMRLFCYGTLAGGFLSARWLGRPEPAGPFENRSLTKYKLVIDDFGGWRLFQKLLQTLDAIATKHGVSIAAVASRHVLDQPQVAGVIVGARYAEHLPESLAMFSFRLDTEDRAAIGAVLAEATPLPGDCFTLERDREGRHGRIMKYNLNRE